MEILNHMLQFFFLLKPFKGKIFRKRRICKILRINFCTPIIEASGQIQGNFLLEMQEIISYFIAHYEELDALLGGRLLLQQSFPRCFWPQDFIEKLEKKKQIT